MNRARALALLARYPEALAAFDAAIEAARHSDNVETLNYCLVSRADVYRAVGNLRSAEQDLAALTAAVGTTMAADSGIVLRMQELRARIDAAQGHTSQAVAGYSQVIEHLEGRGTAAEALTRALRLRSETYLQQGNADAASRARIAGRQTVFESGRSRLGHARAHS